MVTDDDNEGLHGDFIQSVQEPIKNSRSSCPTSETLPEHLCLPVSYPSPIDFLGQAQGSLGFWALWIHLFYSQSIQ